MKLPALISFTVLAVIVTAAYWFVQNRPQTPYVSIRQHSIPVEIARTPAEQSKGLSFRERISRDSGMLFVFGDTSMRTFWMHEMRFPLDFVWLDGNRVIGVTENVPVKTDGSWTVVRSAAPSDGVLELNAGTVKRLGIKNADIAELKQ